jgi:Putative zinc-finger
VRAMSQHLSSTQVSELLDERLDPGDRDSVITHLSTCAECRHEVAELHGALSRVHQPRARSRWMAGAAIAAAAVVAFVAIPRITTGPAAPHENPGSTRTSTSSVESVAQIRIVQPPDRAVVSSAVAFTWRAAGADASYMITVQDAAGAVIWFKPVSDTSAALPGSVKLASGAQYFWSVDARLADGSSASSGAPHSFTAR